MQTLIHVAVLVCVVLVASFAPLVAPLLGF